MDKYIITKDKNGVDRIIRTRPPIFVARVVHYYDPVDGEVCSNSFDIDGIKHKIVINELLHDALDSKIRWVLNQAAKQYAYQNK